MHQIMPFVLSIIGMSALILIGRKRWYGWAIAFGNECLWVGFAIATKQYGFIMGAIFYGAINFHNAMLWRCGEPWISWHSG